MTRPPPFSQKQFAALEDLTRLWNDDSSFVLVGASAIHCHLPGTRKTEDLDIAVAVSREDIQLKLRSLPGWRPSRYEHEWLGPGDVRLDVLPASLELIQQGFVE